MCGRKHARRGIRVPELCLLLFFLLPAAAHAGDQTPVEVVPVAGHQGNVNSVAFSSDDRWLATAGADGTVRLWDAQTGQLVRRFSGHDIAVGDVAFSPDGTLLAASANNITGWPRQSVVHIWETGTGGLIHSFREQQSRFYVARQAIGFSPDGTMLAAGYSLWNVKGGTRIRTLALDERIPPEGSKVSPSLAFSPDGKRIVIAGSRWQTGLWNTATGQLIHTFGDDVFDMTAAAFSPNGSIIAIGSTDGVTRLWDAQTGELRRTLDRQRATISSIAFSPDGKRIAMADHDWKIVIRRVEDGGLVRSLTGHGGAVLSIAFSHDGAWLASGSVDQTFLVWDMKTGRPLPHFRKDVSSAHMIRFSPDGRLLVSAGTDGAVRLWDRESAQLRQTLGDRGDGTAPVQAIAFSDDGHRLVSGDDSGDVRLWEKDESGAWGAAAVLSIIKGSDSVTAVAFLEGGRRIISGTQGGLIRFHDTATGALLRSVDTFRLGVLSLALSPGGLIAASGEDNTVRVWEAQTGRLIHELEGHRMAVPSVAFSRDGTLLASGGEDGTICIWDSRSGKRLHVLETAAGLTTNVFALAFSPDGSLLAAGDHTGRINFWDTRTGQLVGDIEQAGGPVRSLDFHPRDGLLATATLSDHRNHKETTDIRAWQVGKSDATLKLWAVPAVPPQLQGHEGAVHALAASPDGSLIASAGEDRTIRLWDRVTGEQRHLLRGHRGQVKALAFSPEGRLLASGGIDGLVVWDAETGEAGYTAYNEVNALTFSADGSVLAAAAFTSIELHHLKSGHISRWPGDGQGTLSFTRDGRWLVSAGQSGVQLRQAATGALIGTIAGPGTGKEGRAGERYAAALSRDGRGIAIAEPKGPVSLLDLETRRLIQRMEVKGGAVRGVHSQTPLFAYDGHFIAALTGPGMGQDIQVWEAATGRLVRALRAHAKETSALAFVPGPSGKSRFIALADAGGGIRIAAVEDRAEPLAALSAGRIGGREEWFAMTPKGFFAGARTGGQLLAIVRGLEVTTIEQVHQSLFNPDLVREALAGDASGEVAEAAKAMNLEKVLESGPAPSVAIVSPAEGSQSAADLVTVTARVEDRGKGVGRVEWRVNGITAAVAAKPSGRGPVYTVTRQLALDPGDNTIEVVAYNGGNLLASLPARSSVKFTGPADKTKPKLHILAIGIDAYEPWTERNQIRRPFGRLTLAVKDANSFAAKMKRAAGSLYQDVIPHLLENATRDTIDKEVTRIAKDIHPRDTFILFAAAHGMSKDGRFYLIPQDYKCAPERVEACAIGQDHLQDWLANRIRARRALILIDTCESGALVAGHLRSRLDEAASEAGVGRLHEATGRPVLTAAAQGQYAREGLVTASGERQGFFTYAILNALKSGDSNGNGLIELSELVAYVQDMVPKLADKNGGTARAQISAPQREGQTARSGSRGEDFVVASRLP